MKQDTTEICKLKETATSGTVATMKSLFGMCNGIVDSDVGKSDCLLIKGILHECGYVHV